MNKSKRAAFTRVAAANPNKLARKLAMTRIPGVRAVWGGRKASPVWDFVTSAQFIERSVGYPSTDLDVSGYADRITVPVSEADLDGDATHHHIQWSTIVIRCLAGHENQAYTAMIKTINDTAARVSAKSINVLSPPAITPLSSGEFDLYSDLVFVLPPGTIYSPNPDHTSTMAIGHWHTDISEICTTTFPVPA